MYSADYVPERHLVRQLVNYIKLHMFMTCNLVLCLHEMPSQVQVYLQDRFQHLVPMLNKLGNTTVGLTLMLIGVLGVIESRQHQHEAAEQLQPVTGEGAVIQGILSQQCVYFTMFDTLCTVHCATTSLMHRVAQL